MKTIATFRCEIPVAALCAAMGIARASSYRWSKPSIPRKTRETPHPRSLGIRERQEAIELLHGSRFSEASPAAIYATLLDEGRYLCSLRSLYRILKSIGENRERRQLVHHGKFAKPELIATAPNHVWSWDITKLLGPTKWNYFYLYVLLDIFSRYVVGWTVAERESGALAKVLIEESVSKQNADPTQLTIHSDRGGPMKSKPVAFLLADLGVTKSLSRPQVSNDNPFSEAQFKTMKYSPRFPERFGCLEDARAFCGPFFKWNNEEHRHSGIGYHTPGDVHYGRAVALREKRNETLAQAYLAHPERFVRGTPIAPTLPEKVWINPPEQKQKEEIPDRLNADTYTVII